MKYSINGIVFNVEIVKKNNKNTYIRVKENNVILVTTSYFVSKKSIIELLNRNESFIISNYERLEKKKKKDESFYLLGKEYNIIFYDNKRVEIIGNNIYVSDLKKLNNWLNREIKKLYKNRVDLMYQKFEEKIPYPSIRIRKMSTRWGVCNRRLNVITLNTELIKYDIEKLDYVIVHELSHFIHPNHSNNFWLLVSKYCSDFKRIRKELKE